MGGQKAPKGKEDRRGEGEWGLNLRAVVGVPAAERVAEARALGTRALVIVHVRIARLRASPQHLMVVTHLCDGHAVRRPLRRLVRLHLRLGQG